MELTCTRCHQTLENAFCYCPNCGLPQITYSAEIAENGGQPERWNEAVRDAGSVDWKSALRSTLPLAIPAGILCTMLTPMGIIGMIVMGATAAWTVALYSRRQRPSWITIGAGARIGLVTGVVGGWTSASMIGVSIFALRFWWHQGSIFDDFWQNLVDQKMVVEWQALGVDAPTIAALKAMMLSPEGRAGWVLFAMAFAIVTLTLFATAGGALGARMSSRGRRS